MSVSYTHLDVYKRQVLTWYCTSVLDFTLFLTLYSYLFYIFILNFLLFFLDRGSFSVYFVGLVILFCLSGHVMFVTLHIPPHQNMIIFVKQGLGKIIC